MGIKKPSDAEEEYFKREDLERIRRLREKLDAERERLRREQERQAHWMRCPKCGGQMEEVPFRGVIVDRCTRCGYVGFDKGELELLLGSSEPWLERFARELRSFFHFDTAEDPLLAEVEKREERS